MQETDPLAEMKSLFTNALKDLTGKIDAINSDIVTIKTGKVAETRRAKVDQVIKGLRDSQKKAYARIPVDKMTDEEFETTLAEIGEEVNDIIAENKANGSVVSAPLGGTHRGNETNGKEATKEELDSLIGKFNL